MYLDPDALAAFWRCLRETRSEIIILGWKTGFPWLWKLQTFGEHTINVGYLREYRGDAFGRN